MVVALALVSTAVDGGTGLETACTETACTETTVSTEMGFWETEVSESTDWHLAEESWAVEFTDSAMESLEEEDTVISKPEHHNQTHLNLLFTQNTNSCFLNYLKCDTEKIGVLKCKNMA